MASRFGQQTAGRRPECPGNKLTCRTDSWLLQDPPLDPLNEPPHSAPWWADLQEPREDHLREQLKQMDEHVVRLQDTLRCEQNKCSRLQLRLNQQGAELRRREQLICRLKERLMLLTDRHRERAPAIEVLNFPPGGQGKRRPLSKPSRQEEAVLRVMLERREAELREAMKLRHSLTTLLHALRVDMEHTLVAAAEAQDEALAEGDMLDQAEVALGDHVTGGVVQSWRQVQNRLDEVLSEDKYPGGAGAGTDHDKLLARLETELRESQQLVRFQQQLLQDSLAAPVPPELDDAYFLEEWERLRARRVQLDHQRRTFERERQAFTDAAVRLSHERRELQRQKASVLKEQYLSDPPASGPGAVKGHPPNTPSPTRTGRSELLGSHLRRVRTPSTPELYSALNLSRSVLLAHIPESLLSSSSLSSASGAPRWTNQKRGTARRMETRSRPSASIMRIGGDLKRLCILFPL
ncbi:afadin- and alpha-actinin-binding protein [Antennarius striatus]|uniref:afadin- and alpha-actinin-binding protein n=1 Tax=Antennarius striatus TaxID=241820 RepID=UPI0035B22891